MKSIHLLISVTMVILLLNASASYSRVGDEKPAPSLSSGTLSGIDMEGRPLIHQGKITIKVKEGLGPFTRQQGVVRFGVMSLDETALKFQVNSLFKRFRHRPIPHGSGLPDLSRIYILTFPESHSPKAVARAFANDPDIEYAEPIPIPYSCEVPNDPLYSEQQHLPQIMAPEAWGIHHGEDGAEEVIIAIVDRSVEWYHPDLIDNIWQNLGEDSDGDGHVLEYIGGNWVFDPGDENGIDDDHNGYIDDFVGWNFINQSWQEDNNPAPTVLEDTHGTHCAGIAAGVTNNGTGIASVSWNLKIMATSHSNDADMTFEADPYQGIIYCADNGADVISNSWTSGFTYSLAHEEVVAYANGLGSIVVGAAGGQNVTDVKYPAGYPGCISVASVAVTDVKAYYSNFGIVIDVAAPGGEFSVDGGILSTIPGGGYDTIWGTSMATPLVGGLLGLVQSYNPGWTDDQIIVQVLGTADDIDDLNPGYENMLGSGRINAYGALDDIGVVPQELRLELFEMAFEDQNGNGILEQGETVTLDLTIRNYAVGASDESADFTLSTDSPDITITDGSCIEAIPEDDYVTLDDAFTFQIDPNASSHVAAMTVSVSSDIAITYGEEMTFELVIAPSGVLVWEGVAGGQDYSGSYISDFLPKLGLDPVSPTSFPPTLAPFDVVFLSFGNYGTGNTFFLNDWAAEVRIFLESGGAVYLDGGDALGDDQASNTDLLSLFSLASAQDGVESETPIDNLAGQPGTLAEGMLFTESTQEGNGWIDIYTPNVSGSVAFIESDVGNVAVQGSGTYGQKTFCFSYALARLVDRDSVSNRYNLLREIVEFFELSLEPGYVAANFVADATTGPIPFAVQFSDISICDPGTPINSWEWDFENDGVVDSGEQNPNWIYDESGTYSVRLVVSNGIASDTLLIPDMITVYESTWTIENSPYYIDSDILIAEGDTLFIDPGVEVIFTDHCQLIIEGSLQALGTAVDSILFTCDDPGTGWGGIRIIGAPGVDDSTKIAYAIIEHGHASGGSGFYSSWGGGIFIHECDEVAISHCSIHQNECSGTCPQMEGTIGGGIAVNNASPIIRHSAVINNHSGGSCGGIALWESSALLEGCLIADNVADFTAGGTGFASNANDILMNCTISNNAAAQGAGFYALLDSDPTLVNTIIWGSAGTGVDLIYLYDGDSDPDFYNCDVEGGVNDFGGAGAGDAFDGAFVNCIDADPLFSDTTNGDYHITDSSPCIGAGLDSIQISGIWFYAPPTDIEGQPRPNPPGSQPDIGAYENEHGFALMNLTGTLSGDALLLQWTACDAAAAYWVYGASNLPHFVPGILPPYEYRVTVLLPWNASWSSANGVGDPDANWTYLVLAVDDAGQEITISNRVGEFDFEGDIP